MCTLAIYFQVFPEYPVVVAANRDELLARPASGPTTLGRTPHIIGGKDLKAGGTWLGLNECGLIAGLLNRRSELPANPSLRSRGLLCLQTLGCRTAAEAAEAVRRSKGSDYNYFNLLMASREEAFVAYNRNGEIEMVKLARGLHLLTNLDVNDFECPKISRAFDRFAALSENAKPTGDPQGLLERLTSLLADHATQLDPRSGRPNSLCLHLDGYGTRSSSVIILGADPGQVFHFFAAGPPCTTQFRPAPIPGLSLEVGGDGGNRKAADGDGAAGQKD